MTHRDSSKVFEAAFPFDGYTTWLQPFQVFQISNGFKHVSKLHCHIWQQNHMSSKNRIIFFAHCVNKNHYSFKLTINRYTQPSSMHVQKFCKRILGHTTSHLKNERVATLHPLQPLLTGSRLLNEPASPMTSLPQPPMKSLPTHIPSQQSHPLPPPPQYFLWSCANFDDQLVLPE
jgi:hypothetical protein